VPDHKQSLQCFGRRSISEMPKHRSKLTARWHVTPRLDWASAQFSEGSRSHEMITSQVDGNLGYVVQLERVRFKVPGRSEESLLELRATMIFRREPEGWRIIHRPADSQMTRQGPR